MIVARHALNPVVARALVARVYPIGRPDDVAAPQRVGPRVKPGDDALAPGDDALAPGDDALAPGDDVAAGDDKVEA